MVYIIKTRICKEVISLSNQHPISTTKCEVIPGRLQALNELRRLPPVHKCDVAEVEKRIDTYFRICAENELTPTCEGLTLSLGITRQAVHKWGNDGSESGKLVSRAKSLINTLLSQSAVDGKLSPVYLIWAQKNWYGYSDAPQVVEVRQANAEEEKIELELNESGLAWDAEVGDFVQV
jgi:hypothetical protein